MKTEAIEKCIDYFMVEQRCFPDDMPGLNELKVKARAELAKLREDRERYRYYKEHHMSFGYWDDFDARCYSGKYGTQVGWCSGEYDNDCCFMADKEAIRYETLDEALDAAIAAEKETNNPDRDVPGFHGNTV